jgi:TonB-dependent receptor
MQKTIATFLGVLFVLFIVPNAGYAQSTGQISGTVISEGASEALPGANVLLSGDALQRSRGTSTNERGRFSFSAVPAGTYTLEVTYIGYESVTREVDVESGQTATIDVALTSAAIRGREVVVLGTRSQGQAKALSQQKNAANVVNVIASDQMGRFPDATVPATLQRVPGINIQRDQGEARYVQIRGGSAGMTQVSFNGANVPSPEGEERQVALDAIPIELMGTIEVNKAITPDMEAEATGGAVNLVTKRPPQTQTLSIEAGTGYGTIRDNLTGKGSVTYGNQFGNVGVLVSGSFNHRRFGSDGLEAEYSLADNPSGDQVAEMEQRIYDITRQRTGFTAFTDYSFGPNSRIYLNGVFTELYDDEYQPNLISIPEDSAVEFEIAPREETARTYNIAAGGEHLFGRGTQLEYKAGWVHSEEDTPVENTLLLIQEGISFTPSVDGPQTNPSSLDALTFDEYERETKLVNNTDVFAEVDLAVPFELGTASGTVELGGKIRNKNADQSVDLFVYGLADGASDIDLNAIGSPFSVDGYEPGAYTFPDRVLSAGAVNDFASTYASRLEREKDVEGDTEDYDILERTSAAYLMTELNVTDQLLVLPGVRYEHTRLEADGNAFDAETETLTPTTEENSYGYFFPMLHLRYRIGDNTNVRGAVTRTLERPNYFFSVPYQIRDGNEVERGNPGLDPMTSINYDLMVEHYSESVGIISGGAFAKQLTDPIFTSTTMQNDGTTVFQPENASSGHIVGFELNLQRQLLFLPSPLDGVDLYANYTYTDSEATLNSGRVVRLPGQTDQNWNLAVGYEKYGFSARLSFNYSGDYIEELGEPLETFYVDNHFQVDASASYQFSPHVSASVELVNLNNEPFVRYQGRPSRPAQQEFYQRWGRFSILYDL